MERKRYLTTEKAGFWVAGKKIPNDLKGGQVVPKVGHELRLTHLEAKYELLQGTIVPASDEPASKRTSKTD